MLRMGVSSLATGSHRASCLSKATGHVKATTVWRSLQWTATAGLTRATWQPSLMTATFKLRTGQRCHAEQACGFAGLRVGVMMRCLVGPENRGWAPMIECVRCQPRCDAERARSANLEMSQCRAVNHDMSLTHVKVYSSSQCQCRAVNVEL